MMAGENIQAIVIPAGETGGAPGEEPK